MYDINKCDKIEMKQGAFYLGESVEEKSVGYMELKPHTSLDLHNRVKGIENLVQVEGKCVVVVFDKIEGSNHKLEESDVLSIELEGVWHIHANPFDEISLTYRHFDGDIRKIIEAIRKGGE